MRVLFLLGWLMLVVCMGAFHFGPGQQQLLLDDISMILAQADQSAAEGNWSASDQLYEQALTHLPPDKIHQRRQIRLQRAKVQMFCQKLPMAHQDMKSLVDEMTADETADARQLAEARAVLANSQYYMTWLMRLEGQPRDEWEPEIEAARQSYRLLAEQADNDGDDKAAQRHLEDLESAIRLARMDLSDLQGLPIPSQ